MQKGTRGQEKLIILLVIVLDQLLKNIAPKFFPVYCNEGIAFGLFQTPYSQIVVAAVLLILVFYTSSPSTGAQGKLSREVYAKYGLALILGGGISNFIDRLTVGCVRDFIDLWFFPSFNLADASISIGVGILIAFVILRPKGEES